jgi:hypothetical protein
MGMLWTDNDIKCRIQRITSKVFGSPMLPILAWGKVFETLVVGGPLLTWTVTALVSTVVYVIAEDFVEYVTREMEDLYADNP